MRLAITGATGYIGTRLTSLSLNRGCDVHALSRRKPSTSACSWSPFELASTNPICLPPGTDAVVHLAANTTCDNTFSAEAEISAVRSLLIAASEVQAKFIFVSSQTARPDAPTSYGRTKWQIEQKVLSAGGYVVRPGQVYGGELRGMFGMLAGIIRKFPALPLFLPAPRVQPIHVDDLAEGLFRISERNEIPPGLYRLADPDPIPFSRFLAEMSKTRLRCRRGFVPVPVFVVDVMAVLLGKNTRVCLRLDSLRSLVDLPVMETSSDLQKLGITLRSLCAGMHPSGSNRRRYLLQEGRALLGYILKKPPSNAVLSRYIHAVEVLRNGKPMELPSFFIVCPSLISLLDWPAVWASATMRAEFVWRLEAATLLAEATTDGSRRFLGLGSKLGVVSSLILMTHAMVCEAFWLVGRLLLYPVVRHALSSTKGAL